MTACVARPSGSAVLALLAAFGAAGDDSDDSGAEPGRLAVRRPRAADPAYVVQRVETGGTALRDPGCRGPVWVSNYGDDPLVWIDPATGAVSAPIPTGDQPCGLAYGAGSIWVEDYGSDEVTRVNATTAPSRGRSRWAASPTTSPSPTARLG